jgi:hypoxanthine phosphoribosyltransferase
LSKYNSKTVLVVDDINDTGTTLIGINDVIESHAKIDMESAHQDVTYSTLFDKESSQFSNVEYTANRVLPDEERWIVFPYEEWWK